MGAAYQPIYSRLARPTKHDLAYQLREPGKTHWLRPRFQCYDEFRRRSAATAHKTSHVAFVDIAAYYENINHAYLESMLNESGVAGDVVRASSWTCSAGGR